MPTAWAPSLRRLALAAASIGAATLRLAATARSTGAARSSPRSTFALTSSSDMTSLFGSETAPSPSISSMETRSSSSPTGLSHHRGRNLTSAFPTREMTKRRRRSARLGDHLALDGLRALPGDPGGLVGLVLVERLVGEQRVREAVE